MLRTLSILIPTAFRKKLKLHFYAGKKYECLFCGYRSRKLAPIGVDLPIIREKKVIGAYPRRGGCYHCGSRDRDRLVFAYLKHTYKLFSKSKELSILHLAPEVFISKMIRKEGFTNYICGDLHCPGYHYPDFVENVDILNLPFRKNQFDLILCNHVLEHVTDDFQAMKELFRVLKPGGKAILQVPISKNTQKTIEDDTLSSPMARKEAFGQFDHVRIYGQDYPLRLRSAGFEVTRESIAQEFSEYGLNEEEDLFLGSKPK